MTRTNRVEFRVTPREEERLRAEADRVGSRFLSHYIRYRLFDQDLFVIQQQISELHNYLLRNPEETSRERRR